MLFRSGSYRLRPDGSIVITFSVLPELKGHSITFTPNPDADGKALQWVCTRDAGFPARYAVSECRQ